MCLHKILLDKNMCGLFKVLKIKYLHLNYYRKVKVKKNNFQIIKRFKIFYDFPKYKSIYFS